MLVEVDDIRVLMDTGLSFSAVHNAQLLGIDLAKIDRIVLSHGHVDRTGGLRDVLRITGDMEVIGHPDIWAAKYVQRDNSGLHHIGVLFPREELESCGASFNLVEEPVRPTEHAMSTGEIPMLSGYEMIEDNLFVREGNGLQPDPMADDLALVIDADSGLVVVLGCVHRGIVNTLHHAQTLTGNQSVYAVIGGAHLFRASKERVEQTIADLNTIGVKRVGVSDCTGFLASAQLARESGNSFFLNNAGSQVVLPIA